jgi:ABC-type sugar transport system permease subunit
VFEWFSNADFKNYLSVSVKAYFITTLIGLPLGLLFAFYIFKKLPFWGGFRVILFLPSILSGVVVARIFSDYLSAGAPAIFGEDSVLGSLLDPIKKKYFPVLMFYNIWIGFGTAVLMYSNKMSAIPEEIIESAHLDGAMGVKEFWYIVLPLTYSTVSVFLITGVAQIFVNQFGAYDMFTGGAHNTIKSIGYWFFVEVASKFKTVQSSAELPYYSAIGVVLTFITIPAALGFRWVLEHFGPSED